MIDEINKPLNILKIKNSYTIIYRDKIISFYSDKTTFNSNTLTKYLKKNISEYMIPNYLFRIKKFPLNQNGKISVNVLIENAKMKINED